MGSGLGLHSRSFSYIKGLDGILPTIYDIEEGEILTEVRLKKTVQGQTVLAPGGKPLW